MQLKIQRLTFKLNPTNYFMKAHGDSCKEFHYCWAGTCRCFSGGEMRKNYDLFHPMEDTLQPYSNKSI